MAAAPRQTDQFDATSEALLERTLTECDELAARLKDLLHLADALIAVLPPERRISYLESAAVFRAAAKAVRSEPLNDNIIKFVKGKEQVTASEVREALTSKGLAVDQKQIANSLDYLVRRGQLERIGRGQYRAPVRGGNAADAAIEDILTELYGPPTFRGYRPTSGNQLPPDY
jgi:hypothetical protein